MRRPDADAVRAFVAVELDEPARRAAAALARALRDRPGGDAVRWVRPEGLHVTLRFLGNIDPAAVSRLAPALRAATAPLAPFRLALGGVRAFPSVRRPRVVALDLEPVAPLAELAGAVERAVVTAGFAPEKRPFRAHLTLGRVRGDALPDPSAGPPAAGASAARFDVTEAVLFRSELRPGGARYTALERAALGGEGSRITP